MRVLIVDLSRQFGGASTRALSAVRHLPAGLAALATLAGSPVQIQATKGGLEHYALGKGKLDPRIGLRLAGLVRDQRFDLVDTQNPQSHFWAAVASLGASFAVVSTLNSWYADEWRGGIRGRFYQRLESATARRVDLFIVVSEDIRTHLRARGVGDERIVVVENAVAPEVEGPAPDRGALRRAYGLSPQALICCAVGRLVVAKGYEHLIRAMRWLVGSEPNLHCLVVGAGPLRASLDTAIRDAGLEGRVRLLGFMEHGDTLALMRSADLFVLPSVTEGTPLALLEAASLGLPVVATRVGGIPTMLVDGEQALLVDPGDAQGLAEALQRLLRQPEMATRLGCFAQRRIREHFNAEAQAERLRQAYDRALHNFRCRR